ncbi:MAG: Gfo/Idh/MocA family oxidoreductase [Prolixibacteraceae bacterium]|jgi:predicted dehydrogenase|nr:Gfo/Idh/MocA family oxidoreductase [Prolixibacteraceae bacterium]
MKQEISRREFVKNSIAASVAMGITRPLMANDRSFGEQADPVKVGVIGTGARGTTLMRELLKINDVEITAVCDLFKEKAENAVSVCKEIKDQQPRIYCRNETTYREMLEVENLDAVIIATYWDSHAPIALYAMERGIYPGIEVPAALTADHCWQLVETSEKTGIPCMMLENWSFRRDNLAVLNMIRAGLFGEVVHSHCAHSHDCIDHWFFDSKTGEQKWPARYLLEYNRDQYPTHSVGPVLSWLDINCGDVITEIYSTASASKGINTYLERKFGKDHPNARLNYKQGDIVTSLLRTNKGKTIVVNYDMQLPRPYSNRWMLQGTLGVYDEEKSSVYLTGKSPEYHQWEPWKPHEEKYLHKWWQEGTQGMSHGGVDFVMLKQFVNAVRIKGLTPIDVYDSVVMSAIVELSGISIEKNRPVPFPDFTKGAWDKRKPSFAI